MSDILEKKQVKLQLLNKPILDLLNRETFYPNCLQWTSIRRWTLSFNHDTCRSVVPQKFFLLWNVRLLAAVSALSFGFMANSSHFDCLLQHLICSRGQTQQIDIKFIVLYCPPLLTACVSYCWYPATQYDLASSFSKYCANSRTRWLYGRCTCLFMNYTSGWH